MGDVSTAAAAAVGKDGPSDWELKPELHAGSLPPEAGPLKRVLMRDNLKAIIDLYISGDADARTAQTRYRRLALTAAVAGFGAVLLGGLMLLPKDEALPVLVATAAPILQFALLAISILSSLAVALFKPFDTWMHARARAETARVGLFRAVLAAEEPSSQAELPLLPLQLEYFRRYQLEVQRAYYRGRGGQHARSVRRAGILRLVALLLAALAGVPLLFTLLGPERTPELIGPLVRWLSGGETAERILLSASVIGGGLQGLLASYSLVSQSERNAVRYLDTAGNLDDLSTRPLEDARLAAGQGEREPVLAFAALVDEQISSEHREWIALRSLVPDLSLGKLKVASLPQLK